MDDKIKEIIKLAKFHGFDIEAVYPDGEKVKEQAVTIEALSAILFEVLGNTD